MDNDQGTEYLENLQILRLEAGDVIAIQIDQHCTEANIARIAEEIETRFPVNKCIVLTDGAKIGIVRESKIHE